MSRTSKVVVRIKHCEGSEAIIEKSDDGLFVAFWNGGTWPDSNEAKTFDTLAAAMGEVTEVIESYMEGA